LIASSAREIEKNVFWKRNIQTFGYRGGLIQFSPNCFIARTCLLPSELTVPEMETAEDSLLVILVIRRGKPIFSYQATAFQTEDAPNRSGFESHPQRQRDEISLVLRGGLLYSSDWLGKGSISEVQELWSRIEISRRKEQLGTAATGELASADLKGLVSASHWVGASVTAGDPTIVDTVDLPWGYSAILPLAPLRKMHSGDDGSLFWEVEAEVSSGEVGIGLIDNDQMVAEKLLKDIDGRTKIYLPAAAIGAALLVRNGANNGASRVRIYGVRLIAVIK